ncbi:MAG: methyl-accepting chemotaxis protein [Clostridiales bacterium]|nr:methyl-accepting chemotaxis protein [Clostridiales bacterium]
MAKDKIKALLKKIREIDLSKNSVRTKIIGVIMIPVVFIIILGVVSYLKSSKDIISTYETSSFATLEMMADKFTLGFETVSNKANQFITNDSIKKYYSGNYEGDGVREAEEFRSIQNLLVSSTMNDSVVQDVFIFADYGSGASTRGTVPKETYQRYLDSEEGKAFIDSKARFIWAGYHYYLDEIVNVKGREYGLSLTYYLYDINNKKIGFVVIDVKQEFLMDAMENAGFGDGSIIGFIASDGREILAGDYGEDFQFGSTNFYQKSLPQIDKSEIKVIKKGDETQESLGGTEYVRYKGKPYLYLYTPLEGQEAMVCALIPSKMITKQADEMLTITVTLVVIASFIAIFIGSIFASGISKAITKAINILNKTAKGDLTVKADLNRNDEFEQLADGINDMIEGVKKLIRRTSLVSKNVAGNAGEVSENSEILLSATEEITRAVEEIEDGANVQAADAQDCLALMSNLSNQIGMMTERAENMGDITDKTQVIIREGTVIVGELSDKANDTANITKVVINDIQKLGEKSLAVSEIIGTINDVAEQTNLLSLNASIEAARAGAAGRGFAVVAEEIRKLAVQSRNAADQIGDIIDEIVEQTEKTVSTTKEAENIVESQGVSLQNTVDVFYNINAHVENLTANLIQILDGIFEIERTKDETMKAVGSITSTTQQTAAATGELGATGLNQMKSVEVLNKAAIKLNEAVQNLEETMAVFLIGKDN